MGPAVVVTAEDDDRAGQGDGGCRGEGGAVDTFMIAALHKKKRVLTAPRTGILSYRIKTIDSKFMNNNSSRWYFGG
ncbi:conserved hypothetical protein [Agrobacterium fabacearum CFBP 5771]|nr:conserved hypothetical protein [Agrobacterium fabacearum CFBP 5771]